MKLPELKKILHRKCRHWEEWQSGPARIVLHGYDPTNPRFDRKMELFLDISRASVDLKKIKTLLTLLDNLGHRRNL